MTCHYLPDSSDDEPKLVWCSLKSAQGSESIIPTLEAWIGGLEYPSSSTSGVGVADFWVSSPSDPKAVVSFVVSPSKSSSLLSAETFLDFLSFFRLLLIPKIPAGHCEKFDVIEG